jgi:mono/diheme cytochrome c family protein
MLKRLSPLPIGCIVLGALGVAAAFAQSTNPSIPVNFDKDVAPIFKSNCTGCHGESVKMKELNLNSEEAALKGSESGPVVVSGKPDESILYKKVRDGSMPMGKAHLSDQQIETIFSWIKGSVSDTSKTEKADNSPVTQQDVVPILLTRCTVCHGLRKQEGGLDLRSKASMLKGGTSGPAMVLGKPEDSLLIKRINAGEMPPKQKLIVVGVKPIAPAETEKIARWIRQGAPEVPAQPDLAGTPQDPLVAEKDRQFWAFQTPRRPEPPPVKHGNRVRNPIDAFVLSKLESKGLSFSPEADRLTLMRRAYFDLTGLPPEPREIREFVADKDPQRPERL